MESKLASQQLQHETILLQNGIAITSPDPDPFVTHPSHRHAHPASLDPRGLMTLGGKVKGKNILI